jgi:hypothetical protein
MVLEENAIVNAVEYVDSAGGGRYVAQRRP